MKIVDSTVTARNNGEVVNVKVMQCENCEEAIWHIYFVEGEDQPHLQCVYCDVTYCQDGKCGRG